MADKASSENKFFPKRHASFDSPREIPLPSPPLTHPDTRSYFPFCATQPVSSQEVHHEEQSSVYPARPFSLPDAQSFCVLPSPCPPPSPRSPCDRLSSASLPLPCQVPFYALPRVNTQPIPSPDMAHADSLDPRSIAFPSSSSSTQVPSSHSGSDRFDPRHPPDVDDQSTSDSSSASDSSSLLPSNSSSSDATDGSFSLPRDSCQSASRSQNVPSRPISPFRAPQPPPPSARPPAAQPTAMRPFMSLSQEIQSFPPPDPPIILPEDSAYDTLQSSHRIQAPYVPFLSHAPPPPDSWIEVETTFSEYRLHVRLPGFSREGITLATKRRRILHLVADSWDNAGGHFERRISFGYDADLVQVRAEFDGVMLRIIIPRRISPVVWQSSRPGLMGRA